jgi:hypothetical protein
MTILKPERTLSRIMYIISALIGVFALTAIGLIAMYAKTVTLEHDVSATRDQIQKLESDTASIRDKTYAMLDATNFETLAAERMLVKDRNPRYVTIDPEWSLVSRY